MEVGQQAGQHYSAESWKERKRWERERDTFYSAEGWKERKGEWMSSDGGGQSTSSSPTLLSSLLPIISSDGNVDKVLYQNLVEMIPLVESFMDQQGTKSFSRHASLVYTPTPSRDSWPLKKAVEHPSKGKKGRGQLVRGKRGELKDSLFWDNAENMFHDNRETYAEEIPMLSFPTDHQVDQNAVSKAEILQLQSQIEQLEQKLQEKDSQLQSAENNANKQIELLQLQTKVEGLQRDIWEKEHQITNAQDQLSEKQHEVAGLHSLLEKAQEDVQASNMKAVGVEEELNGLRCQVAALLFQIGNISAKLVDDQPVDLPESSTSSALSSMEREQVNSPQAYQMEAEDMELTRRKYLAALIAARENPGEELLSLVGELRAQLQNYVMHPTFDQSSRFSLC